MASTVADSEEAGDRVETDRRDSQSLARLHRAGELSAVDVPDEQQEALRDLTRAREDMKHLQQQAKQRLLAFLLRQGKRYAGKSPWTQAYSRWLETVKFEQPVQQIVLQEYIDTVMACGKRVANLDQQIEQMARASTVWPVTREGHRALIYHYYGQLRPLLRHRYSSSWCLLFVVSFYIRNKVLTFHAKA